MQPVRTSRLGGASKGRTIEVDLSTYILNHLINSAYLGRLGANLPIWADSMFGTLEAASLEVAGSRETDAGGMVVPGQIHAGVRMVGFRARNSEKVEVSKLGFFLADFVR